MFLVLGAWFLVLGAWCLVLGFENPEPGTRNPEPGTRNPEPGTRFFMLHFFLFSGVLSSSTGVGAGFLGELI